MAYILPPLGYSYDAIEPHFDQETIEIHHSKHHQTYVTKLNAALEGHELASLSVDNFIKKIASASANKQKAFASTVGGMRTIVSSGRA